MNVEQSVKIIEESLSKANKAGCFELRESVVIYSALMEIIKKLDLKPEKQN